MCLEETGKCLCDASWGGLACDERDIPCPNGCSNHGVCDHQTGKCICDPSWGGLDCTDIWLPCPTAIIDNGRCTGHGTCDTTSGSCTCETPWYTLDCRYDSGRKGYLNVVVRDLNVVVRDLNVVEKRDWDVIVRDWYPSKRFSNYIQLLCSIIHSNNLLNLSLPTTSLLSKTLSMKCLAAVNLFSAEIFFL